MMNLWQKTELARERFAPLIAGVVGGALFYWLGREYVPTTRPGEVLTAAVSIAAITVGFLANMMAILFSIERKRIIEQLKDADLYKHVISYVMSAIRCSFVLAIASGVALAVDFEAQHTWMRAATAAWVSMTVLSIATYYRVVSVFFGILKSND